MRFPADSTDEAWRTLWGHEEPGPSNGSNGSGSAPGALAPRGDDVESLKRLFRRPPPKRPAAEPRRGDIWPPHNYNASYTDEARRQRRLRRATDVFADDTLELWEVDDAVTRTRSEPPESAATPAPRPPPAFPAPVAADTPAAWLELLARNAAVPETTEAQLVRAVNGDPRRFTAPLIDVTDVIEARPRHNPRTEGARIVVKAPVGALVRKRGLRFVLIAAAALSLGLALGVAATVLLFA